jgi:HAD superfamily hydrolase (TIGR01459 family)
MTAMFEVATFREIAGQYDAFLFDQFGVLHDGSHLYPGVLPVLTKLAERQAPVVIMTNSGKRSAANRARIERMGVDRRLFADVVSSGEVAWYGIRDRLFAEPFRPGRRAFIIGRAGDEYGFDDLGLERADAPAEAECLLILGSNAPATSLDGYELMLRDAAVRRVPALCCNPDRLMLTAEGVVPAPGAIAERYAAQGGPVTWIGKPHREIYLAALGHAGHPAATRSLAIGDSIEHDIAGGRSAGLGTALVRTGVSADLAPAEIERRCQERGVFPDWVLPSLEW